jgi:hypothetical protein
MSEQASFVIVGGASAVAQATAAAVLKAGPPVGWLGQAAEVADAIPALAPGGFITGAMLDIDGACGWGRRPEPGARARDQPMTNSSRW